MKGQPEKHHRVQQMPAIAKIQRHVCKFKRCTAAAQKVGQPLNIQWLVTLLIDISFALQNFVVISTEFLMYTISTVPSIFHLETLYRIVQLHAKQGESIFSKLVNEVILNFQKTTSKHFFESIIIPIKGTEGTPPSSRRKYSRVVRPQRSE